MSGPKPKFLADCRGALSEQDVLQHKDHSQLDERRTRFVAEQAETSCRTDEEDVMSRKPYTDARRDRPRRVSHGVDASGESRCGAG